MDTFEPACIIWPGVKIQNKVKFIYSTLFYLSQQRFILYNCYPLYKSHSKKSLRTPNYQDYSPID